MNKLIMVLITFIIFPMSVSAAEYGRSSAQYGSHTGYAAFYNGSGIAHNRYNASNNERCFNVDRVDYITVYTNKGFERVAALLGRELCKKDRTYHYTNHVGVKGIYFNGKFYTPYDLISRK